MVLDPRQTSIAQIQREHRLLRQLGLTQYSSIMTPVKILNKDEEAAEEEEEEYDYIICGAGTSGCVIASRLATHLRSSASPTILIIEPGLHDSRSLAVSRMPCGLFAMPEQAAVLGLDWGIATTPQTHLNGRVVPMIRGKCVGGSSAINGTLAIRGARRDYDEWMVDGWSGDEMFAYMKKAEKFHPKPWFNAAENEHGTNGPLHTEPYELTAPISKMMLESMESKGLPVVDDLFTTGATPTGCGNTVRTVYDGIRLSSAEYLNNNDGREEKIDIVVNTLVDKVNFERSEDGRLVASSVDLVSGGATRVRRTVRARREVIICAGTYCSPTILMRSGVGPASELAKHDIECQVDLPGVGKNLIEHLVAFSSYEVNAPGITLDGQIHHGEGAAKSFAEYQEKQTGILAAYPFGAFGYTRLDEQLAKEPLWQQSPRKPGLDPANMHPDQPHIEFMHIHMLSGFLTGLPDPSERRHGFDFMVGLLSQRSRGTVELKSKDPLENPIVDPNFLADPMDVLVLSEGMRTGNEIVMEGLGTKGVIKGGFPTDSKHHTWKDREDWIEWIRNNSGTGYHPAGTCKMGSRVDDPMVVVDERLRVRGVERLRVADCSIMPTLNGGHTQLPAYAIGEKAADMIIEDWKL